VRTVAVVAVLFVAGFLFFGIYWPKHRHQAAIDRAAAVVDEHRANAVARAADLEAIVKTLPTLELREARPPLPDRLGYALVMTGVLRQRAGLPPIESEPSLGGRVHLDQAMSLVETGKRFSYDSENDDAEMTETMLAPLATMRYALLLDTISYQAPTMRGDNLFVPGVWSANAYFFDVPARAYIAGWRLGAESSPTVGQGGIFQGGVALDSDLEHRITDTITRTVREHVSGVR